MARLQGKHAARFRIEFASKRGVRAYAYTVYGCRTQRPSPERENPSSGPTSIGVHRRRWRDDRLLRYRRRRVPPHRMIMGSHPPPAPHRHTAWHAVGAVTLGATIYLLWRSPGLLVFRWAAWLGLASPLAGARSAVAVVRPVLPDWFLFSAPDALWTYALTVVLVAVWRGAVGWAAVAWCAVPLVLGGGGEIAQALGILPGTFDPTDLSLSLVAFAAAFIPFFRSGQIAETCIVRRRGAGFCPPCAGERG